MTESPPPMPASQPEIMARYQLLRARYGQRDSDIHVSTFSRSGTTWMQLILYQLTTPGDMTFDHLFEVSPWLYYNAVLDTAPTTPPEPRILKTHDNYEFFAPGTRGRFIYVVRDGRDVAVSFYHHRINAKAYDGSFADHFRDFIHGMDYNGQFYSWFHHVRDWLANAHGFPMLVVHYEDLVRDFDRALQPIIEFLEIPVSGEILARTRARTTFAFMKQHEHRLGPKPRLFPEQGAGAYRVRNPHAFIRQGQAGSWKSVLTPDQVATYRDAFHATLAPFPSLRAYAD